MGGALSGLSVSNWCPCSTSQIIPKIHIPSTKLADSIPQHDGPVETPTGLTPSSNHPQSQVFSPQPSHDGFLDNKYETQEEIFSWSRTWIDHIMNFLLLWSQEMYGLVFRQFGGHKLTFVCDQMVEAPEGLLGVGLGSIPSASTPGVTALVTAIKSS